MRFLWSNGALGQALLELFVEEARAAGALGVWVATAQTNAPATATYRRSGFRVETHDDLVMVHELEADR